MKDILLFVKEVGLPAAIAFYVLMRLEPAISANTRAIMDLSLIVERLLVR
jgi:hypothetical protein